MHVPDLFGDIPVAAGKKNLNSVPKKPKREVPVVTGGLFSLRDTLGPGRYSANYWSGASAIYDAIGLTAIGKDVGVVANLVRPRVAYVLRQYLRNGGKVFCDNGAYTAFQQWEEGKAASPVADFERVFRVYDDLLAAAPAEMRFNLALVAPDVLCDHSMSLDLLRKYRDKVRGYIDAGANVIVPLQRGPVTAGRSADMVKEILGTGRITLGIPTSAAAAMDLPDVATIRNHDRFHVLGRSAMTMSLFATTYAFLEVNPGSYVSCDANQLRSSTSLLSYEQSQLIKENEGAIWESEFDDTELLANVLTLSDWMTVRQVTAIANFYGVNKPEDVKRWVAAHREDNEGLKSLIEAKDPECELLWSVGLSMVFKEAAEKHLSARMRVPAIRRVFQSDAGESSALMAA
jgi:hypothetical protein